MKEMNRREFLTLTGAAVVALSLAGCGGAPSAPTPPDDIRVQQALDALNKFRRDKGLTELVYEKELEELTDLLISPFVKEGKPVVDRTKFSSYVDVKENEIKQALFNKGYPIYETYFTAGLGPEGTGKLETLKYPTNEAQKQNWLTYMSGGVDTAETTHAALPCRCAASAVRITTSHWWWAKSPPIDLWKFPGPGHCPSSCAPGAL